MKTLTRALMTVAVLASLTGCGTGDDASDGDAGYPAQPVVTKTVTAKPEPVKRGHSVKEYREVIEPAVDATKKSLRDAGVDLDDADRIVSEARKIRRAFAQATR